MLATLGSVAFGLFGLAVLIGLAVLCSKQRHAIDWKLVASALVLQFVFAAVVLKLPDGRTALAAIAELIVKLLDYAHVGAAFIFGPLADSKRVGVIFAVQILPTIVFFAALTGVLYHLGVMQAIVRVMAWGMMRVMRVSGAEATSVCASVFIGQTEAPLTIKPYLARMTEAELMTVMIGGMAHIAGSVMAAYVGMLGGGDPARQLFFAKHLLTASVMAAPATMLLAKILVPERDEPLTRGVVRLSVAKTSANLIDAAAGGATDGLKLALNVGAMLLAFVALIALANAPLQWLGVRQLDGVSINQHLSQLAGHSVNLSLQTLLGWLLAPLAWLIGVPWRDATQVGALIGEKLVLNEFVAYADLAQKLDRLLPRSQLLATYALCGFANFSSIAIQVGGIGGLAPERRSDLARLGMRAVLGGTLATLMTATIAGMLESG